MKLVIASLLAVLTIACRSAAPPVARVEAFGPGTSEIVEKTHELHRALLHRDQAAIDSLLAPEYTFHFIDYEMRGTLQAMPNAPRGRWALEMLEKTRSVPIQSSVVDARAYGDLGMVISHYRWYGDGFRNEGYVTDIWIRRDGLWQLLAGHASLLCPSVY